MVLTGLPPGPTTMRWSADVSIMGTIASVGSRLIEGTADRLINQAFDCMRAKLEE
jgi:carbon monoxide dehydrogenase subunit G